MEAAAPKPETPSARPRTAPRRSWSTSRPVPSSSRRPPTTWASPSSSSSTSTVGPVAQVDASTSSTRASTSSAAPTPPSAGSAIRAVVVDVADGTPRRRPHRDADRSGRAKKLFTALRAFIALGGAQARASPSRDETYNGTTITVVDLGDIGKLAGMADARLSQGSPCRSATSRSRTRSPTRSSSSGPDPASSSTCSTRPPAPRSPSNDDYKKLVDRVGPSTGSVFVDIAAIRGLLETAMSSAGAATATKTNYDDRHQAVPRPVRRVVSRRARSGWRPDHVHGHHHRQVSAGRPQRPASTEEDHHHSWQSASGSRASARTSSRAIGSSSPTAGAPVTGARSRRSATTTRAPNPTEFVVDADRAKAWLAKGAQPSDTVARLFRQAGILPAAK